MHICFLPIPELKFRLQPEYYNIYSKCSQGGIKTSMVSKIKRGFTCAFVILLLTVTVMGAKHGDKGDWIGFNYIEEV